MTSWERQSGSVVRIAKGNLEARGSQEGRAGVSSTAEGGHSLGGSVAAVGPSRE